jgi:hypothetical protein
VPALRTVIVTAADVAPRSTPPKSAGDGSTSSAGAVPVPVSVANAGVLTAPGGSAVTGVRPAWWNPVVCGANATEARTQDWPMDSVTPEHAELAGAGRANSTVPPAATNGSAPSTATPKPALVSVTS